MYEGKTVAVVVPAYNEEGFVGDVIETLPEFVDRAYVVDDCSTDDTWGEITETADRINETVPITVTDGGAGFETQVVPIRHEENRGVGGAIKTGYLRAREDEIDVTAVMGGDGQMDPEYLEGLVEPIADGRADYAKGNRLIEAEHHADMPGYRYVGNWILTYLTKIASGYWHVGDPQMGYTAISLEALEECEIEEMYEFYGYCNDLIVRLSVNDLRVVDVPTPLDYGDEKSHISYASYVPFVSLMLLRTFLWRLATKRETGGENVRSGLYVGGAAGLAAGVLGRLRGGNGGSTRASIVGVVALLSAMLLDAVLNRDRNYRESE